MAMRYDFDMVAMTPDGLPDKFGNFGATGVEKVAMFRDPRTVAALNQADTTVQTFFTDSGFALQAFDSGAPPGRFPIRDENARIAVIDRLSTNLSAHNLNGANWGGFDFQAFMGALATAEPIADELLAPTPGSPRIDQELAAARVASQQKRGRRMIAFGGLMLGLILLFYVASQMLM